MNARIERAMIKFEKDYPKPQPRKIGMAEWLAQQPDDYIRYIFQQAPWEAGNADTRAACVAEYENRFGNWPSHISK